MSERPAPSSGGRPEGGARGGGAPEEDATPTSAAPTSATPGRAPRDEPVLPDRAGEDRPEAWGERADEDDDERYLRERPPHW